MFDLIKLPYSAKDLEPYMSAETLDFHHGKHLNAYVTFVNDFVEKEKSLQDKTLDEIVVLASSKPEWQGLFNNAGQVYNHNEFFQVLKKNENPTVPEALLAKINASFGSLDKFKEEFINAGKTQFGSGWVWLVANEGKLEIRKYANAGNPLVDGVRGLLVCDVWEHAYYIDYRNKRPDFLTTFINNLVDWNYVEAKMNECTS